MSRRRQKQTPVDDGPGKSQQSGEEEETGKASDGKVERNHTRQKKEELIERTTHLMRRLMTDMLELGLENVRRDENKDVESPCRSTQGTKGASQGNKSEMTRKPKIKAQNEIKAVERDQNIGILNKEWQEQQ